MIRPFWATRWRRLLTLGVVGLMVFSIASVEITSQSWFCNSCHIMNSYYASWKVGPHKDVACVECHIPPGKLNYAAAKLNGFGQVVDDLLERTSTKPSAAVSDFSCTRAGCHDLEKVRAVARRKNPYFFDHAKHLGLEYLGIVIHCTTCHSHLKGERHFEVNTSVCITCHLSYAAAARPPDQLVVTAADAQLLGLRPTTMPTGLSTGPASAPAIARIAPPVGTSTSQSAWAGTTRSAGSSTTQPATAAGQKIPPSGCQNCHTPPEEPINYRGLKVVHAEYLAYGAACESCHRGVTSPARPVRDAQCFSCHDFGMEKMTDLVETHRIHNQGRHKVECYSCHGLSTHGPETQAMRLDQIDCQACHKGQHAIQRETYATVANQPHQPATEGALVTPMFMAHVDCTGCHIEQRALRVKPASGATVAAASPKACDACHKPGLGEQMIPQWQQATHQMYDSASRLLPGPGQPEPTGRAGELVRDARRLLELVRLDGSWGVHNPKYTEQLIKQAKDKLIEAETLGQAGPTSAPAAATQPDKPAERGGRP